MHKGMLIGTILLSKCFPPGVSVIRFGRYQLHAVPVPSETEGEAILSFVNTYKDPIGRLFYGGC